MSSDGAHGKFFRFEAALTGARRSGALDRGDRCSVCGKRGHTDAQRAECEQAREAMDAVHARKPRGRYVRSGCYSEINARAELK